MDKKFSTPFRYLFDGDKVSFDYKEVKDAQAIKVEGYFRDMAISREFKESIMLLVGDNLEIPHDDCTPYDITKVENLEVTGVPKKLDMEKGKEMNFSFAPNGSAHRIVVEGIFERVVTDSPDKELYIEVDVNGELVSYPIKYIIGFKKDKVGA